MTGEQLKLAGMKLAEDNANAKHKGWSEMAYNFLVSYAKEHSEFLAEDVRNASIGVVPEPAHLRAWGAVIVKGKRDNVIRHSHYTPVQTPSSHCALASVWRSNIFIKQLNFF